MVMLCVAQLDCESVILNSTRNPRILFVVGIYLAYRITRLISSRRSCLPPFYKAIILNESLTHLKGEFSCPCVHTCVPMVMLCMAQLDCESVILNSTRNPRILPTVSIHSAYRITRLISSRRSCLPPFYRAIILDEPLTHLKGEFSCPCVHTCVPMVMLCVAQLDCESVIPNSTRNPRILFVVGIYLACR
jgi:hypothetical protein